MNSGEQHSNGWERTLFRVVVALTCGIGFFAIAYGALAAGHPNGDAYILYRYVENTAAGEGIVYNPGGERAEGATDFLWFALLTIAVRLGADVALAAAGLNAIGAALAGWLLAGPCWGGPDRRVWVRAAFAAILPAVVFSGGALAAYSGFSSMLYSALILLLYVTAINARGKTWSVIPVLGLVVSLFRPDGVIIAVGFCLIGFWYAWSERVFRLYLWSCAGCAAVGVLYFLWRWSYFGLLLPLPLYVKQHTSTLAGGGILARFAGLEDHMHWLADPQGPALIAVGLAGLLIYARGWKDAGIRRALLCLTPVLALLLALSFAAQSQNIQWRFQAPVQLLLILLLVLAGERCINIGPGRWARRVTGAVIIAVIVPTWLAGLRDVWGQLNGKWNTYLEAFAPSFGPDLSKDSVVAVTEAGILPYWSKAHFIDLVGLNTVATAKAPGTVDYLRDIDPDMVFYHTANLLKDGMFRGPNETSSRIVPISRELLWSALPKTEQDLIKRPIRNYGETGLRTTGYAALLLTRFLSETPGYELYAVDFKGNGHYVHIYGFKTDWSLRAQALNRLRAAMQPGNYRSYLAVRDGT